VSDDAIRNAERAYRASGAPQDGEAYVQAVLRSTGLNSTFLIARVIETQRVMHQIANTSPFAETTLTAVVGAALARPVTPDDMVSFLRGGREWLEPPSIMRGQQGTDFLAVERPAIHPAQVTAHSCMICGAFYSGLTHTCVGRNPTGAYDAVPTRGVPAGSAILCNHANENPGHCPCEPDCYCRQDGHTCSDVSEVFAQHDGRASACRLCSRNAHWQFKQEPRFNVCALHLGKGRLVNRETRTAANNSLSEMVRHHEAVDDV